MGVSVRISKNDAAFQPFRHVTIVKQDRCHSS
jgi:hypothetical protein